MAASQKKYCTVTPDKTHNFLGRGWNSSNSLRDVAVEGWPMIKWIIYCLYIHIILYYISLNLYIPKQYTSHIFGCIYIYIHIIVIIIIVIEFYIWKRYILQFTMFQKCPGKTLEGAFCFSQWKVETLQLLVVMANRTGAAKVAEELTWIWSGDWVGSFSQVSSNL